MVQIPGTRTQLPAILLPQGETCAADAWKGPFITVRLTAPVQAIRVHLNGGAGASRTPQLAGSGLHGRWFAIGDVIQTYAQYRATHALPAHFTHVALATLRPGTVLNAGVCAPLFDHRGGGEQVELVSGPPPLLRELDATWSHQIGHA